MSSVHLETEAAPAATVPAIAIAPRPQAAPEAPVSLQFELLDGPSAETLLASPDLARAWDSLYAACPWKTVFQGRPFASTWFDIYGDLFIPVVVTATADDGRLAGLLVLAATPDRRHLHVAGAHQCEYQAWLALPHCGQTFIVGALDRLRERFPAASLTFMHLPPGAPLGWVESTPRWKERTLVETMPRALRDVGDDDRAWLKKKGNKSRIRQLARVGEISFTRVTDATEFSKLLDDLIPLHEFRQGAIHGVMPFTDDPRKRPFHEALFRVPGFFFATALRVGGRLVAAQLGIADGTMVSIGPHSYDPEFAAQSPGKLQLHYLAELAASAGYTTVDLTPGAGWKDRFATRGDEVGIVRISFRRRDHLKLVLSRRTEALAKRVALRLGSSPDQVRALGARLKRSGPFGIVGALVRRACFFLPIRKTTEVVVSTLDAREAPAVEPAAASPDGTAAPVFRVNSVEDLLCFRPWQPWQTRTAFLSECLERIGNGHRVYTHVEDGELVSFGWVSRGGATSSIREVETEIRLPEGTDVAYDFSTVPSHRGRGLYTQALRQAVADARREPDCREIWIGADRTNVPSMRAIRKLGFRPLVTLRLEKVLGRTVQREEHRRLHTQPTRIETAVQIVKRAVYRIAKWTGLFALARRATRDELRVFCWHGFDLNGECEFGPRLFMRAETFEKRLDAMVRGGYPVLPLAEAVDRMNAGTLPSAAVVLTIDDGAASVAIRALEPISRRKLPATLYVTTYHVENPTPVFETSLVFLIWKTASTTLDIAGLGPFTEGTLPLTDSNAVRCFGRALVEHAKFRLDEPGRQALARETAKRLGVDWDEMIASRRCSLATPDELRAMVAGGIEMQLHTHRHRFPRDEAETIREVNDNRAALDRILPGAYDHICYPSNEHDPAQFPWLRALGVKSGTTCNVGLNPKGTEPLALHRFLDGECVSQIEFEAELSGFAELCRRAARRIRR